MAEITYIQTFNAELPNLPVEQRLQERDKDVRLQYMGLSGALTALTTFAKEGLASELVRGFHEDFWKLPR